MVTKNFYCKYHERVVDYYREEDNPPGYDRSLNRITYMNAYLLCSIIYDFKPVTEYLHLLERVTQGAPVPEEVVNIVEKLKKDLETGFDGLTLGRMEEILEFIYSKGHTAVWYKTL